MSLLTGPKFLHTQTAVTRLSPGSRWLRASWVLSRALCRYRALDFAEVPRAKRAAALRLQLSQFAPFSEPGYAVAWEGHAVQVWCWDAAKLRDEQRDANVLASRARVLPETLYFAPLIDGLRLLKVAEGYEGQLWKSRVLTQSRFWDQLPDARQWLAFQRDAGIAPELQQAQASPIERDALLQPYTKFAEGLANASPTALIEPLLLFALVAALGTCTAWYAVRYAKLASLNHDLSAQMKSLETKAAPVLTARESAIDNDVFVRKLLRVAPFPDQLSLMAQVAATLPGDATFVREWNYNQGKLKFQLTYPSVVPAASTVVGALQEQPGFSNVRAMPANDPKSLLISADIKPVFINDNAKPDSRN